MYLLGTKSQPVLQPVLCEADTIKDQEAGRSVPLEARGQGVNRLVRDNAEGPAHRVVAHHRRPVGV